MWDISGLSFLHEVDVKLIVKVFVAIDLIFASSLVLTLVSLYRIKASGEIPEIPEYAAMSAF